MGFFGNWFGSGGGGHGDDTVDVATSSIEQWTPIVAVLDVQSAESIWVIVTMNSLEVVAYRSNRPGDTKFSELFAERSTVSVDGTEYTISLLPSGGWWTTQVKVSYVVGEELT